MEKSAKATTKRPVLGSDALESESGRKDDEGARPDRHEDRPTPDRPSDQEWPKQEELPPERIIELYPKGPKRFPREKDRYTPFLVLRFAVGDSGARPLAPGTVFWHSPDVWVESSAGMNIPVAGEPNRIFARVNNWGMKDQSNVVVRYWWANPSLAITEANAHLIGMTTTSVPAGYSVVTECPTKWIPVIENQGHECVLAEAFAPYWDPLVAPLEPVSDRHACQKNLHVIEVPVAKSFQLTLEVANITGDSQRVVLTASTLPFRMVREALYAPDIGYRKPLIETAGSVALKTSLSESGEFLKVGSKTFAQRLLAEDQVGIRAHQGLEVSPGSPILTTTFKPWELRRLTIEGRPESDTPGQAFGFEFREQIGNVITGGYRLYVVTV